MPRLRFLRPSTGLGLEKRGIYPPIWSFIGRFLYLCLFAWLLPALISASLGQVTSGDPEAVDEVLRLQYAAACLAITRQVAFSTNWNRA